MFPKKKSFMVRLSFTTSDIMQSDCASQMSPLLDFRLSHYVPDESP